MDRSAWITDRIAEITQTLAPFTRPGEPYALLDWPNHGNVGDSAIWLGEIACGARRPPPAQGRAPSPETGAEGELAANHHPWNQSTEVWLKAKNKNAPWGRQPSHR